MDSINRQKPASQHRGTIHHINELRSFSVSLQQQQHLEDPPLCLEPCIFLGTEANTLNQPLLRKYDIQAIINCAIEVPTPPSCLESVVYLHIPLKGENLEEISHHFESFFGFLDTAIEQKMPVLVHCTRSSLYARSSALLIAYFMRRHRFSLQNAYDFLRRDLVIKPYPGYLAQLSLYERELIDVYDHPIHTTSPTKVSSSASLRSSPIRSPSAPSQSRPAPSQPSPSSSASFLSSSSSLPSRALISLLTSHPHASLSVRRSSHDQPLSSFTPSAPVSSSTTSLLSSLRFNSFVRDAHGLGSSRSTIRPFEVSQPTPVEVSALDRQTASMLTPDGRRALSQLLSISSFTSPSKQSAAAQSSASLALSSPNIARAAALAAVVSMQEKDDTLEKEAEASSSSVASIVSPQRASKDAKEGHLYIPPPILRSSPSPASSSSFGSPKKLTFAALQ